MKKGILTILIITILAISATLGIFYFTNNNEINNELIELSGQKFKEKIENKDSFILVIVQTGCDHCEAFKPVINNVIKTYGITAYSINLANLNNQEKNYLKNIANVDGTPTTIFIVDGEEETTLNRLKGNVSKNTLINRLKSLHYIESEA